MERILTDAQHWIFVTLTSYAAVLGGLLLWIGFIFIGLISRRFEQAYGKTTYWQFHMAAPAGLFVYLVMQSVASLKHHNLSPVEQWIGYALLAWSAGQCLWGVFRFRRVLSEIM